MSDLLRPNPEKYTAPRKDVLLKATFSVRINVGLTEDQHLFLKTKANREGTSMLALIRYLIDAQMDKEKKNGLQE